MNFFLPLFNPKKNDIRINESVIYFSYSSFPSNVVSLYTMTVKNPEEIFLKIIFLTVRLAM